MEISIETTVNVPLERVWLAWITPEDIRSWNYASDEWCCPKASVDFRVGGNFNHRMEAKDGSAGFDLEGTFTGIEEYSNIEFVLEDERTVRVEFRDTGQGIRIVETFEAENEHSVEQQRQGWQCILDNFRKHVESLSRENEN